MSNLILPGNPLFDLTLGIHKPPVENNQRGQAINFVMGTNGVLRAANWEEVTEYLEGGEYDEVIGKENDEDDLDPQDYDSESYFF